MLTKKNITYKMFQNSIHLMPSNDKMSMHICTDIRTLLYQH